MPARASAPPPLILLPPSEGKLAGGDGPPWREGSWRFEALHRRRRAVIRALRTAIADDEAEGSRLLGVSAARLDGAVRDVRGLDRAPTRPACERYDGVVWRALDATCLGPAAARRMHERVLVLSGMWGVVAPGDPLPPYRLKMSVRLGALGTLSTWWRPSVADVVDARCRGGVVFDLLPAEHAQTWRGDDADCRQIVRVRFEVARDDGSRVVTGHDAKHAKGLLARHLLTRDVGTARALAGFTTDGYVLDRDASDLGARSALAVFVRQADRSPTRRSP